MFFQTIYGLFTESTEVGINIKLVNDKLTVAVMPRHRELKEGTAGGFSSRWWQAELPKSLTVVLPTL